MGKVSLAHTISKPLVSLPLMCRLVSLAVSWKHPWPELWDGLFGRVGSAQGNCTWELGSRVSSQERCSGVVLQSRFYPPLTLSDRCVVRWPDVFVCNWEKHLVCCGGNWAIKELKVGVEWILKMRFDSSVSLMVKFLLRKEEWNIEIWSNFYRVSVLQFAKSIE